VGALLPRDVVAVMGGAAVGRAAAGEEGLRGVAASPAPFPLLVGREGASSTLAAAAAGAADRSLGVHLRAGLWQAPHRLPSAVP